ncbi:c-type cytochrome [Rubrimonas cliftonensis]|uniref:Cytochrome c553 n=1 Tax=Rubrimonas cliftonensis TaxID=89524 RepID=A0A1H3W3D1_9RHOB|nr:cytochrome c [Rubrimonas cliftonensis]SDZ80852.1 Cytochrome c553 [Rubrimonas cliftonensis]
MLRLTLTAALLAWAAPGLAEGDAEAGYKLARMCSACHGRDGAAVRANTPSIAGLDAEYISEQLMEYRSGGRVHPEMNIVAGGLKDDQISDLAAWFAAQEIPAQ